MEKRETRRNRATYLNSWLILLLMGLFALLAGCDSTESAPDTSLSTQALGNIRFSYSVDRTGDAYLHGRTLTAPACIFFINKNGPIPAGSTVEFLLDGTHHSSDRTSPYNMGNEGTCNKILFPPGNHVISVKLNGVLNDDAAFTSARTLPPTGTSYKNISDCAKITLASGVVTMPGNVSSPVALAPDGSVYVATFSSGTKKESARPVALRYANGSCSQLKTLTDEQMKEPIDSSHDAPSIYVDGEGHVITSYYGRTIGFTNPRYTLPAPYFRRTTSPGNLNDFNNESTTKLLNYAELQGFRMKDGKVFIAGEDFKRTLSNYED